MKRRKPNRKPNDKKGDQIHFVPIDSVITWDLLRKICSGGVEWLGTMH